MKKRNLLFLVLGLPMVAFGQTKEERERIASFSNKEANEKLSLELILQEKARITRINDFLQLNPQIQRITIVNGVKKELMDVLPNGEFVFAQTDNAGAATTARATTLYSGGSLGINVQGQNMIGAIWDGGNVRSTHQEFMVGGFSKITNYDGATYDYHPTHVAGTICAQGINPLARGLAFNSSVSAFNWTNDMNEMLDQASTNGLLVSNHSYGIGSLDSKWFFGAYDSRARNFDNICYNNPYYLPVVSAGNSRNLTTEPALSQINQKSGYDLIFGHGNAKNVMTVAAVNEVSSYTGPSSVVISSFSSFGPSDDGRIKPDISMKGVAVRSTGNTADTAYATESGTSMASPGITGVVLLLQQYFNELYSNWMRSATVKGLILHTADEAGNNPGPDFEFGWGLVNAEKAAKTIRDKNLPLNGSIIEEKNLSNGIPYSKTITANSLSPLKISISWTDPAAPTSSVNNGTIDPPTKYLVNDLDVKVTSSTGTVFYPWTVQNVPPFYSAENTTTNNVDNFERVDIANPIGTYTITVTNKGTLSGLNQNFTLIVTGENMVNLSTNDLDSLDEFTIYPNPVIDVLHFKSNKKAKVSILDNSGKLIKSEVTTNNKISVSELTSGMYYFIYKDSSGKETTKKFIKK